AELANPIRVRVLDSGGKPVSGQPVSWTAGPGAEITPASPTTDSNGRVTATWTLGPAAGAQKATANAASFSVEIEATAVAAEPDEITRLAGHAQSAPVGSVLPDSLSVRVVDRFGNPVPDVTVSWS